MSLEYQIDPQLRLVRSRAWGTLTDAEIRAHYAQIEVDPAFRAGYAMLCDLRGVDYIEADTVTLRNLAKLSSFGPGTRRAFLVARDEHFGLARMLQTYCELEGIAAGVFRALSEAEDWLQLPLASPDTRQSP